jgi:hypothetical protein
METPLCLACPCCPVYVTSGCGHSESRAACVRCPVAVTPCRCSSPATHVTPLACRHIPLPHDMHPPGQGRPIQSLADGLVVLILAPRPLALCVSQYRSPTEFPPKPSLPSTAWHRRVPFAFYGRAAFDSQLRIAWTITVRFLAPVTFHGSYLATPLSSGYGCAPKGADFGVSPSVVISG